MNARSGRPACGQLTAEIEHGDLVTDVEDEVRMAFDQQNAGALLAAGADR
ncbi:hypothetical protein AAFN86_28985 [Roseomonas sp. CAU 1739]